MLRAALLVGGAAIGLSACNTVAGMGEDTSAAGQAITRGADEGSTSVSQGTQGTAPGCATPMHENLPGGTDYDGPPVAGCTPP
jgi:predicted small secreted protein